MSAPNKQEELEVFLFNLGAKFAAVIGGEKYYRVPGHASLYSLSELLEAYE